jgi:NADH pyrophosphatase NudC (nudix superfamily)
MTEAAHNRLARERGDDPARADQGGQAGLPGHQGQADLPGSRGEAGLPYNQLALDRAAGRRDDPAWVASVLARPSSRVIAFWQDKCLASDGQEAARQPVIIAAAQAAPVLAAAQTTVLLGLDGQAGVFAADLSPLPRSAATQLAGAAEAVDVRAMFGGLDWQLAATLGYARGILRWNREQRYCGACGQPAVSRSGGTQRLCSGPECGRLLFPRIEPAVIALVEAPGPPARCLLARHRGAAAGAYATLAGFVEIGESLEDAVRREVAEETGVRVGEVRYQASQAWPFPAGLMIGFRARAVSTAISVDPGELDEARWFTRAELSALLAARPLDRGDSIESHLVGTWLREPA